MKPAFISFIRLNNNIVDSYEKSKSGWRSKMVTWEDIRNVMSNSKVQYSNFSWRNGYKTANNFNMDKLTHLIWDIDDGLSIAEFQRMFSKYNWVLGTTKSNMKNKKGIVCERYRVIIEVINPSSDVDVFFRAVSLIAPFVDPQTLTMTAAYLGHDDAIIVYNEGKALDMFKANELAERQLENEAIDKASKYIDPDLVSGSGNNSLQMVKDSLTFDVVVDVLERVGYEVVRNKFKLREDENTRSATISYKTLTITDFGSGYYGDIIDVLVNYQQMSFRDAIRFVSQSI